MTQTTATLLTLLTAIPLTIASAQAPLKPSTLGGVPPKTWVDKDTGHRVIRLTDEPGSSGFYFNINAYTPDLKNMIFTAPDGIHVMDLASRKEHLLVPNPPRPADTADSQQFRFGGVHAIIAGRITNSVFYTMADPATHVTAIYKADVYTGAITKLTDLPKGMNVATINADETLGAGTINDSDKVTEYGANRVNPPGMQAGPLVQPANKGEMMEQRLAAHIPLTLNTINLQTGKLTVLLHSTDWINHLLFSPKDPQLLMYCHEGPWQKVDRIWMIHTDGTQNTLIHHRTIAMEIAGHEFWGIDGETIWYDWQPIKGQDFYLAGLNLQTGKKTAFHMDRNDWSIHFNLTKDLDVFTGDGGDPGQVAKAPDGEWIELFHPQMINTTGALNSPSFYQPGVFHPEHLVNMAQHNYKLEPNVRFSPDKSLVIFTSNMFGPSYVFAVETAKAVNPDPSEVMSTPQTAAKFNPGIPPDTSNVPK